MWARSSRKGTVKYEFRPASEIAKLSTHLPAHRPAIVTGSWGDPTFPFAREGIPDARG